MQATVILERGPFYHRESLFQVDWTWDLHLASSMVLALKSDFASLPYNAFVVNEWSGRHGSISKNSSFELTEIITCLKHA